MSVNYFDTIYSAIVEAIFGAGANLTGSQVLVVEQISLWLALAVTLLPIIVVVGFILRAFRLR